jgi:hypothetical protein
MRQTLVFRAHGAVQPVNILDVVSALSSGGEILIFTDSRVQLSQNAAIINQQAKLFSGCSRFTLAIAWIRLWDLSGLSIYSTVFFRFIKPGEQFISDYQ